MSDKMKKKILAVDIIGLRKSLYAAGIVLQEGMNSHVDFETFLEHATPHLHVGVRGALEEDLSKWQLLPYFDIEQMTDAEQKLFYAYVRGDQGGEAKLHGLHSCGFAGHIDDDDVARKPVLLESTGLEKGEIKLRETLTTGAVRELLEELVIEGCDITDIKPVFNGLIIDHSNDVNNAAFPVGAVHLGLSFSLQVPIGASVRSGEENEIQLLDGPISATELLNRNIEGWTRIRLGAEAA